MSDDMERALHLRRMQAHFERQKEAALDDAGKRDASRQIVKAAMEITRITGAQPK
jgi:hypothetical protein